MKKKGKIIAAFGIPGSGKSSVTRALGKLLGIQTFHEPEEKNWAEPVIKRHLSGNFTAIMWFRSIRLPQLFEAQEQKKSGQITMLDSYYDKLFSLYMQQEGMQWLFEASDPYFKEMKSVAAKDYELLPDADCIVFFYVSKETWDSFLQKRGRNLDKDRAFLENCFASQEHFLRSARKYCKDKGCQLVLFNQAVSNPAKAARLLASELRKEKVV